MAETSTCNARACSITIDGIVQKCPKCGSRMRTSKIVRRLGWFLFLIGLFLVGLMGFVTYNMAPSLSHPGEMTGTSRFNGTADQARMILRLFWVVIIFGLGTMLNGLWQIVTGRRNLWITFGILALAAALIILAYTTTQALH